MSIYTGGAKSKYQDPPEDATTQQVFSFGDANVISDLIEQLMTKNVEMVGGGSTGDKTVGAQDGATIYTSQDGFDHNLIFEPTSLTDSACKIILLQTFDASDITIMFNNGAQSKQSGTGDVLVESGNQIGVSYNPNDGLYYLWGSYTII